MADETRVGVKPDDRIPANGAPLEEAPDGNAAAPRRGWLQTVGTFADDEIMREISEAGRRIRESEAPVE